eukprot:gene19328-21252_t
MSRRFIINLPSKDAQSEHAIGSDAGLLQPLDSEIVNQIKQYVTDGVDDVNDMQRHLRTFVQRNAKDKASDLNNRRFHPTDKVVRDHMYHARVRGMHSKDDQENLRYKIDTWKENRPNDRFFYQPKGNIDEGNDQKLLFVYQSEQHRHLLARYGTICLLDATYKTTKYALPLFFLSVKTNVDYQVVGAFVCEDETTDAIKEGIQILAGWNPGWNPLYFMTDFDEKELNAIESVFTSCKVYL